MQLPINFAKITPAGELLVNCIFNCMIPTGISLSPAGEKPLLVIVLLIIFVAGQENKHITTNWLSVLSKES